MAKSKNISSKGQYEIKNKEVITLRPNTLHSPSAKQLSMNAQRILFYSIYSTQHNHDTVSFTKTELNEAFGVDFGSYKEIKNYLSSLRSFGIDIEQEGSERLMFINAFSYLIYNNGLFEFKFNETFLPILGEQKRFLQLGMQSIERFKSRYSSYLYQWLKDSMWGPHRVIENIGLEDFKKIFKLEKDAYKDQNTNFRKRVWLPAMNEINTYTSYEINIETKGRGKNIRFTVTRLQDENLAEQQKMLKKIKSKQNFECKLGVSLISADCSRCMRINKCPLPVSGRAWGPVPEGEANSDIGLQLFQHYTFGENPYYDLEARIKNNVASNDEKDYYEMLKKRKEELERYTCDPKTSMKDYIELSERTFREVYFGVPSEGSEEG